MRSTRTCSCKLISLEPITSTVLGEIRSNTNSLSSEHSRSAIACAFVLIDGDDGDMYDSCIYQNCLSFFHHTKDTHACNSIKNERFFHSLKTYYTRKSNEMVKICIKKMQEKCWGVDRVSNKIIVFKVIVMSYLMYFVHHPAQAQAHTKINRYERSAAKCNPKENFRLHAKQACIHSSLMHSLSNQIDPIINCSECTLH